MCQNQQFIPIDTWPAFEGNACYCKLASSDMETHNIPCHSLILSAIVLNDTYMHNTRLPEHTWTSESIDGQSEAK